jgi:hypothetical protein
VFAALIGGLWIVTAFVLTFGGLFGATGNGFFGTWFSTFCALSYCYQTYVGGDDFGRGISASLSFVPGQGPPRGVGATIEPPTPMPAGQTGGMA